MVAQAGKFVVLGRKHSKAVARHPNINCMFQKESLKAGLISA